MLELSHEVNFSMQCVGQRMKELLDVIQEYGNSYNQKIINAKATKAGGSVFRGLDLSLDATARSHGAASSGAGAPPSSGPTSPLLTAANVSVLDDVQVMVRVIQRGALVLSNAFETFTTALSVDLRKGAPNTAAFGARVVPHTALPLLATNASRDGNRLSIQLPPISQQQLDDRERQLSRAGGIQPHSGRLGALSSLSAQSAASQPKQHQQSPVSSPRPPTITKPSVQLPQRRDEAVALRQVTSSSSTVNDMPSVMTDKATTLMIATSFYFSFDALARSLRAREAVAYVQRSHSDEAQAVCVFGGKARHPSTVRVSLRSGHVAAVIKSGIALNAASEDPTIQSGHMLCLPIFEGPRRMQPLGALVVERSGLPPFSEMEAALAHLWTVLAGQHLTGYGVDIVSDPFDPLQSVLRKGSKLAEYLRTGRSAPTTGALDLKGPGGFGLAGFENLLQGISGPGTDKAPTAKGVVATKGPNDAAQDRQAIAGLLGAANYSAGLSAVIAAQVPPQLIFNTSHRNHGADFRPTEIVKGHPEMLKYQNLLDVSTYIQMLNDSWRRSTDDLQDMEVEQISQMQDMKIRMRKLKSLTGKLAHTERQVMEYKERYDVLKKELIALAE